LPTGKARREAHKAHKSDMENPMQGTLDIEETEEIVDHDTGEIIEEDVVEEDETVEEDEEEENVAIWDEDGYTVVAYPTDVAKHFWPQLGRYGAIGMLKEHFPQVKFKSDATVRELYFEQDGSDHVEDAINAVVDLYELAGARFRAWKRDNGAYAALDHTTPEGRKESYQLTKAYWMNYVDDFVTENFGEDLI